ncbi:DUF2057 domain-containing protein [Vibrio vulnificus]|uniref:UPF0319 protein VV2_0960 n=1 Tax=Vibrio vulnificus (strain CMCP6) TaxID=216895 RepID=Y4960_VIBVU|nr:DUF2057 domain-containing protein [Vibrio vulnificus]Q8D5G0.1 RecName: Full=UPF0319 protein VV2_0960; Flags: Precursor [Vibrio vulnificus CMCP6]AAO07872.1 putative secreted protein [Vibrio vulnificus CMCP6]AIL73403.1 hypothetical protein VV93_v1c43520 [Vibrio vulnificus]AMG10301.1 DUF2057 domain-containing protein [Vibrio vulnificus]EGQ7696475.1 DUF2057 domain-containing protein [Vibrio vulnificus]EGQ7955708.1 DUF2057 domain-containing protein [Vibrio vulnificus]
MNIIKPLTCILAMSISGLATAAVTLHVPDDVTLFVANGQKAKLSGSLFASSKTIELPNGENQIVFQYEPYFSQGNDRIGVESNVIIAKFSANDTDLNFELPKYRDHRVAEQEIKQMQWQLVDEQGAAVTKSEDKLVKSGMQIGRDYAREAADYNQTGGIAAIGTAVSVATIKTEPVANVETKVKAGDNTAEEMLHFWYDKADEATKARFKAYINQ